MRFGPVNIYPFYMEIRYSYLCSGGRGYIDDFLLGVMLMWKPVVKSAPGAWQMKCEKN